MDLTQGIHKPDMKKPFMEDRTKLNYVEILCPWIASRTVKRSQDFLPCIQEQSETLDTLDSI